MDPLLRELIDERDIRRALAEYVHGCDRCDPELMASVYAQESYDDHGHNKMPGPAFSRLMANDVIPGTTESLSHLVGQSLILLDGDRARAETYYIAVSITRTNDKPYCNQVGGRYVDTFLREGEQWRIKHRVCMRDWSVSIAVTEDRYGEAGLASGRRDNQDAGVALLRLAHKG